MSAPDTTSPGPSLLSTIMVGLGAVAGSILLLIGVLVATTWFVRFSVFVVSWAWHVGR